MSVRVICVSKFYRELYGTQDLLDLPAGSLGKNISIDKHFSIPPDTGIGTLEVTNRVIADYLNFSTCRPAV